VHYTTRQPVLQPGDTTSAPTVEVTQQDLRPLLRIIDSADGEIPWEDYQDDYERRLTELVEAKVTAAQNPRTARGNGRHRSASGTSRTETDSQASKGSSGTRRKAA
jgi:non-homologous end joining protein Ku